jgi:hypothetical protein
MAHFASSDTQFFADQVEQLDLALDQLALKDRNFDRFAILLIDNVVELTLHRHAEAQQRTQQQRSKWYRHPKSDDDDNARTIAAAAGQRFDPKVKLAKLTGMLSAELGDSILYLHSFRNTAHHSGLRHEGILHALAIFYMKNACIALLAFDDLGFFGHSDDVVPHRATKYLGRKSGYGGYSKEDFVAAWKRLLEVAESMGDTLAANLSEDMAKTIKSLDDTIQFLADDSSPAITRTEAILRVQTLAFARTDEARAYAAKSMPASAKTVKDYHDWLRANHSYPFRTDPIPSWDKRLRLLAEETNPHMALKKYCDFMNQTETLRADIFRAAGELDAAIQHAIDEARGK